MNSLIENNKGRTASDPLLINSNFWDFNSYLNFNPNKIYPIIQHVFGNQDFRPVHDWGIGYSFRIFSPLRESANKLILPISNPPVKFVCNKFFTIITHRRWKKSQDFNPGSFQIGKLRKIYLRTCLGYSSISEARRELGIYFEFYNRTRPHQGLDNRIPDVVYWASRQRSQVAAWTKQLIT